jgi:hypothetical protein
MTERVKRSIPVRSAKKQAKRPNAGQFRPGESGNPAGLPKGFRHPRTVLIQAMFDGEAEAIARVAIDRAKRGDPVCLRLVLERVIAPVKGRTISIDLPPIETAGDIPRALAAVVQAVSNGAISADEGAALSALIAGARQAFELAEIDLRLKALEGKLR